MPARAIPVFERIMHQAEILPNGCWYCHLTPRAVYARVSLRAVEADQLGITFGPMLSGRVPPSSGERSTMAHRVVYQLLAGPIPEALDLDHLCKVQHCVNPAHLEPVTHGENVLRGLSPSAENKRARTCRRGHLLAGDNLIVHQDGHRNCRECTVAQQRANYGDRQRTYAREWYRRNRGRLKARHRRGAT
jgi:hypothetical protein